MQRRLINMRGGHYAGGTSSAAQELRWLHVDGGPPALDFPDGLVHRKLAPKGRRPAFETLASSTRPAVTEPSLGV